MRVFSVSLGKGTNPYTEKCISAVLDGLETALNEMDVSDDPITITAKEMTAEEYNALPEWDGP